LLWFCAFCTTIARVVDAGCKRETDPRVTPKVELRRAFLSADIEFLFCARKPAIPSSSGAQLLSHPTSELFFCPLSF
jgi:hypothetical protein